MVEWWERKLSDITKNAASPTHLSLQPTAAVTLGVQSKAPNEPMPLRTNAPGTGFYNFIKKIIYLGRLPIPMSLRMYLLGQQFGTRRADLKTVFLKSLETLKTHKTRCAFFRLISKHRIMQLDKART